MRRELVHDGSTDLLVPRPAAGEEWNPETIHTHFFECGVPEAGISIFTYVRYLPAFGVCQGGVLIYQGLDNVVLSDLAFHDYRLAMPWPKVEGNSFTTANGLGIDFIEPGRVAHITFRSADGGTSIDVVATAVTPLAVRGHVLPDEGVNLAETSGGSEQFLRYTGELVLNGKSYHVDCNWIRDRSWRQVRREALESSLHPPLCWTPAYFDEDFAFNQMGFESLDADPPWKHAFDVPEDAPSHVFAWVSRKGEVRGVRRIHRRETERHPIFLHPLKMELEIEDDHGEVSFVKGEAIAFAPLPQWYNVSTYESIMRWEDDRGKVAHGPAQTIWNWKAQQAMRHVRATALPTHP
jgi:hypothetical protein